MRVPNDQGLFLTIFMVVCCGFIVTAWLFLPVYHTTEGEQEEEQQAELFKLDPAVTAEDRVKQMEKALAMATATISKLEETEQPKTEKVKPKKGKTK